MQLDLRGRLDRVATRIPPLRVALAVQDRYSALRGNQLAAAVTLTAVAVVGLRVARGEQLEGSKT